MPRETFKSDYKPDQSYAISGRLLNKMGRAAEAAGLGGGSAYTQRHSRTVDAQTFPPPHVQGLAVVQTRVSTCSDETMVNDALPCAPANRYAVWFRWYDQTTGVWNQYPETLIFDASAYWEGVHDTDLAEDGVAYPTDASQTPSGGVGFGPIPEFDGGDVVPAYFDPMRNLLVPIVSPPSDQPFAEWTNFTQQTVYSDTTSFGTTEPGGGGWIPYSSSVFVVEFNTGVGNAYTPMDHLCFQHPRYLQNDDGEYEYWWDGRTSFTTMYLQNLSKIRIRAVTGIGDYTIRTYKLRFRLTGLGRCGARGQFLNVWRNLLSATSPQVITGWGGAGYVPNMMNPGRFADSPMFNQIDDGIFQVTYEDERDAWKIGVETSVVISNALG